ncbi:hypothetical protein ABS735_27140 [Streptomyces sp. MMCC 100]|uniref:hypothetical protein n=1 Tax=Streptomyces sp. MMCC 100 TaxID=3163555 RepID=UPI00359550F7
MTPWLRTLRATGLAGALGVGALVSPYGAEPAHAASAAGAGFAAVVAPSPASSAAGHDPAPEAATVPDGSATHDGRGGHERPRRPAGPDRPERPDAGSASRPAADPGPSDSAGRGSAKPSPSSPTPSASRTTADPEPSRAGSLPGEGRQRPGRAEEREPEHDGTDENAGRRQDGDGGDGVPEDPATATAAAVPPGQTEAARAPSVSPSRTGSQAGMRAQGAAEPVLRVLPLGSGLVLIGLGLALGLVGLRLRRA